MRDFERRITQDPRGSYDNLTPKQLAQALANLGLDARHGTYAQVPRDLLMACALALDARDRGGEAEKAAAFDALASGLRQLIKAVQP